MAIIGWVLWVLACLFTVCAAIGLFIRRPDGRRGIEEPVTAVLRFVYCACMAAVLIVTGEGRFSRLHLYWIMPISFVLYFVLVDVLDPPDARPWGKNRT